MDPVEALDRIAYLLEADRAESYRVRAFRTAASTVADLGPDELSARRKSGRLKDLPGVGEVTARVIDESMSGNVPEYLERLEAEAAKAVLPEKVKKLRERLRGDCHSHSTWSDGGAEIAKMAETARSIGHDYLVLTDHSPRLTIAHGLNAERLHEQIAVVDRLNLELAPFRILKGIEVDILEDGSLDQEEELLAQLDVVVASVHSKLRMDKAPMTERMVRAVTNPHTDILGHCTGRIVVGRGRPESTFDVATVFEACVAGKTAVEINSRPERLDPPDEMLARAVEIGCMFTIDTDAHAPGQLEWQKFGCEKAIAAKVPTKRILNTLSMDGLLEWVNA